MKKKVIIIVILILLVILGVGCYFAINNTQENKEQNNEELIPPTQNVVVEEFVEVQENGIKNNTSSKLKETKTYKGMEIKDIEYYMSNGQTYLEANVVNNSGKDVETTVVEIIVYDKEGSELVRMGGVINEVKNGETTKLSCATTLDFANAYDFKIQGIQ